MCTLNLCACRKHINLGKIENRNLIFHAQLVFPVESISFQTVRRTSPGVRGRVEGGMQIWAHGHDAHIFRFSVTCTFRGYHYCISNVHHWQRSINPFWNHRKKMLLITPEIAWESLSMFLKFSSVSQYSIASCLYIHEHSTNCVRLWKPLQ